MGSHKTIRGSYLQIPTPVTPPPFADFHVSGSITPNATCNYLLAGFFNGKNYYSRSGNYFIFWLPISFCWVLSSVLGSHAGFYWSKINDPVQGNYLPHGTATGTAIVSVGGH
jgi:hypothetical protein